MQHTPREQTDGGAVVDVVATERTRRFHHLDLGGWGEVEVEEVLERTVESVSCHWCGRNDAIVVEPVADNQNR